MKVTKEMILQYLKEMKPELEKLGIEKVALFGSFAKEDQTVYSDIDIAIKKNSDYLQSHTAYEYFDLLTSIKQKIRTVLHRPSDIFDLDSDSEFLKSIEKEIIYV